MRAFFLSLIVCLSGSYLLSQNLIQNGDFEEYSSLPVTDSQIERATPWEPVSITADFFHIADFSNIGASSGMGYAGMGSWSDDPQNIIRESFGQELQQAIQADKNYWFKLSATQAITALSNGTCLQIQLYGFNSLPTVNSADSYVGNYPTGVLLGETEIITSIEEWTVHEFCFTSPGDFSYIVISVSDTNCTNYMYLDDIELYELEDLKIFPSTIGLCDGEEIELGIDVPGAEYVWQNGSTNSTIRVSEPGEYWVSIDTVCNLMLSDTVVVTDDRLFLEEGFLGADTILCQDSPITIGLPDALEDQEYEWNTGETGSNISPAEDGTYSLSVQKNECSLIDSINLLFQNCKRCKVYLPNVFSPDFDGVNDDYTPFFSCDILDLKMCIFDRWGNIMFVSEEQNSRWSGTKGGRDCMQGIYTCVLEYSVEEFGEIRQYLERQDVLLVR